MFKADYHIHSSFSGDSGESIDNIIARAVELDLDEIALTDHLDPDYPDADINFELDLPRYIETLYRIQRETSGFLTVRRGIEIGMQPHLPERLSEVTGGDDFEFIIGSAHCAAGYDFSGCSFYEAYPKDEAHRIYFESLYESIKVFDGISALGHLDFIKRYGRNTYGENHSKMNYKLHMDIIEEILRVAIDKGTGLEVNTSGLRYGLEHSHPHEIILSRYRELGGEIITVGSDAHTARDIFSNFEKVYHVLEKTGFRYICSFESKKPVFHRINT